mmetsp:Transcript_17387/g.54299  ORF Transcript_17387/g.54299 Transcript_17387/m.54299 type:complete len:163 (-) Transcript_17387:311-799(-)|eukprot:CAMPEP_0197394768 /NCGR_PEP_ID=MMETSP1165-20131217/6024_1 /TAXON_ID=284809 /ORGANISM="Chrysocystis fragilis, Strain CCMP3189" /LENGTH=162 /DNA_ID=CAMNT_0042920501 /DNA_START=32 /DNA_END=520 /DNA_ORIENTATION=+
MAIRKGVFLIALASSARALERAPLAAWRWRGGSSETTSEADGSALFGGGGEGEDPLGGDSILGGLPGGMPTDMAEYEKMMESLMDSPMMQEFLNDPEKMELSRQALLNNPMAMQMIKSMPGLEDIVHDKEKWAERMKASKEQFDAMRKARADKPPAADDFDD